jgi:hypothetical protein
MRFRERSRGRWLERPGRKWYVVREGVFGGRYWDELGGLGRIDVTDDEIDILQGIAEVESGGFTQCINTWDSDVVSLGFMQSTLAFPNP